MNNSSSTYMWQKSGFEKHSNSNVLSDITIRYGASGELKFEAHRLLLSAQSRWFEAAFTGGFAESHAREITLVGDDPDALKTMLSFAYDKDFQPQKDWLDGTTININRLLEIYRVGDKYQFPAFLVWAASQLESCMNDWLNGDDHKTCLKDCVRCSEFCGFVRDIYDLVGPEHQPGHPLVEILMELATDRPDTKVLKHIGHNLPLIVMASQEVAEFGRDIFLHLIYKTGFSDANNDGNIVTTELCIGVALICRHCGKKSWKVMTDDEKLHELREVCRHCGRALENLNKEY